MNMCDCLNYIFILIIMTTVNVSKQEDGKLNMNADCKKSIRKQGLVKRLFDETGKLIISPTGITLSNREKEEFYRTDTLLTCLNMESSQLTKYIRKEFIVPPATKDLNLSIPLEQFLDVPVRVPYEVDQLVFNESMNGGFFIEAGANNGEKDSDSLHFEMKHGWSGLLVEPNVFLFSEILKRNRKAYSINTCLSVESRPAIVAFNYNYNNIRNNIDGDTADMLCLPLYSILLSLGNPRVNYFSLDIEGAEFPVLKSIPWDKVDIQVLSVETHFAGDLFPGSREDIINYMDGVGYKHIPWGHKNDYLVEMMEFNKTIVLTNDMFVKKELPVNTWEMVKTFLERKKKIST